jgi:hypothetical protein
MKQLVLSVIFISCTLTSFCRETTISDKLISILSMKPSETTPANVSTLLGRPDQIDEGKQKNVWYYNSKFGSLVLYWDGKVIKLQKMMFSAITSAEKTILDETKAKQLHSGETALVDAIKLLGLPKELEMKGVNQQLRYVFKDSKLNLFFHGGTLVNYTLL